MGVRRYALPALAFLVASAYWPFWDGGALTPRWMILSIGVLLLWGTPIRMTALHWLGLAYIAYAALTGLWTPQIWDYARELWYLVLLGGIFCVVAEIDDFQPIYLAFAAGVALSGFVAVAEMQGWISLPNANHPAGLFGNRNYMAEAGVLAFVAILPRWRSPVMWPVFLGCALAIVLPRSRGALLGLDVVLIVYFLRCNVVIAGALLLATAAAGWLALAEPSVPSQHLANTGILRLAIAWSTLAHMSFFGHGLGSFFVSYPLWTPHVTILGSRPAHPHNEVIDVIAEVGIPGLVLWTWFFVLAFKRSVGTTRLGILALLTIGVTSFPLHLPVTGFMAAVLAAHAVASHRRVLSEQRDRRAPLYPRAVGGYARRYSAGAWDIEAGGGDRADAGRDAEGAGVSGAQQYGSIADRAGHRRFERNTAV